MLTPGDAIAALGRTGGWATRRNLLAVMTARELAAVVAAGRLVRVTRGVYALPSLRPEFAAAAAQGETWLGRRCLRPDLVDHAARIAIEAHSFAFHGSPEDLERDCERYDALTAGGWTVLRFAYRQVMRRPDRVAVTVRSTRERVLDRRGSRRLA